MFLGSCLNSGASLVAVSLKVFTHKHGSCRIFLRAQDELQDRDARRLRRAGSLGISSASESHIGTATTPRTEMVLHRASYRLVNHATRMPDVTLSPALQLQLRRKTSGYACSCVRTRLRGADVNALPRNMLPRGLHVRTLTQRHCIEDSKSGGTRAARDDGGQYARRSLCSSLTSRIVSRGITDSDGG
ncbi:hypothetical protein OH76DRAFT_1491049 [Lentinus brumalis]|uniref:Uncharacterized protein n=1 Tax=Lentinus brumalis TaxID=2498619 RepID=A0A371CGW8_9APHY|nr:hypothetical protein OH76DRAFT_1491049 [Polyporus brumalis]